MLSQEYFLYYTFKTLKKVNVQKVLKENDTFFYETIL